MIYRGTGFFAVVWFVSSPPPPVSKLSLFLSLPVCLRSSLLQKGDRGRAKSLIKRPRERLALYKPFNTFWCRCMNFPWFPRFFPKKGPSTPCSWVHAPPIRPLLLRRGGNGTWRVGLAIQGRRVGVKGGLVIRTWGGRSLGRGVCVVEGLEFAIDNW
jgi:hypothetical protein